MTEIEFLFYIFSSAKGEIKHLDSRGDCFRKIDRLYMETFA
ncbi:hypothetical protein [Listeria monocytogenes]|nr:hypothetical protein [Listeria monocytogenes]KSZ40471.1 hypothetical protein AN919_2371c [Listeria monocytogenes]